jgi:Rrf2 family nitric oxide-sensitive transcriptional repressor
MQLTLYSDYSLRVLIYLGLKGTELATITEIATSYNISRNHLVKVVHNLANHGFIATIRGKGGGMRLARAPREINIGEVVRMTEMNFTIVECFDPANCLCPITPVCRLKGVLRDALEKFLGVLDQYTLEDVIANGPKLARILKIPEVPKSAGGSRAGA